MPMSTAQAVHLVRPESSHGGVDSGLDGPDFEVWPDQSYGPLLEDFLRGEELPAFLGLSAHSSFSNAGRFRGLLRWLAPRVSTCAVLEGTFLTRWNAQALQGMSRQDAEVSVRFESARIERRLKRLISEAGLEGRVFYLPWKELVSSPEVRRRIAVLRSSFQNHRGFREHVERLTRAFLSRTKQAGSGSEPLPVLSEYVFEEIAIFLHMYDSGRTVEVYPGRDLEVMRMIGRGQLPGFPFRCSSRTHVALRVR